jgi:hypothetical protein
MASRALKSVSGMVIGREARKGESIDGVEVCRDLQTLLIHS